jgi:hypothetical protein
VAPRPVEAADVSGAGAARSEFYRLAGERRRPVAGVEADRCLRRHVARSRLTEQHAPIRHRLRLFIGQAKASAITGREPTDVERNFVHMFPQRRR